MNDNQYVGEAGGSSGGAGNEKRLALLLPLLISLFTRAKKATGKKERTSLLSRHPFPFIPSLAFAKSQVQNTHAGLCCSLSDGKKKKRALYSGRAAWAFCGKG
jgi:hypothetical protein